MRYWHDIGDDLSVNACNGEYSTSAVVRFNMWRDECLHSVVTMCYEGDEHSIGVLPGCTAYLFKEHNYEGERLGWIINKLFYR